MHRIRTGRTGQEGYTAIEVAIAMAILATAIFTVVNLYKVFDRSFWTVSEKTQVNQFASFTMDQISSSLREVRSVAYLVAVTPTVTATPVVTDRVVHLHSTGRGFCALRMPNLADPTNSAYDTILFYFLREKPDGTVKLYQRMRYWDGSYTPAVPAMAHIDRLRQSTAAAGFPPEPTPGGTPPVTYPNLTPTPTIVFIDNLGKMPGMYQSPRVTFDDVSFYYDPANAKISFGLTASIRSKSQPFRGNILVPDGYKAGGRKRSMTTTVNLRRTQ